jgi:hypothetical protein
MFKVQAGKGAARAEIFRTAKASHRKSGIVLARRAEVSSVAGNFRILCSLLDNVDGQDQTCRLTSRLAGYLAMAQLRRLPPMRERTLFPVVVANSYYYDKMPVEFCQNSYRTFCEVPSGDRSNPSANASCRKASESLRLPEAIRSSHYSDERGLKICR